MTKHRPIKDGAEIVEPEEFRERFEASKQGAKPEKTGNEKDEEPLDDVEFDDCLPPKPVPMLVERLLPASGLTYLAGQSGVGKTFIAVYLAVMLATRGEFFGYEATERVGVIYLAAEGAATIKSRMAAAKKAFEISGDLPIAVVKVVPDLSIAQNRKKMRAKIAAAAEKLRERFGLRVGCIFIDTIAAAFTIKDENSAAEVNAIGKHCAELGLDTGAAVVAIHHYGKSQETGLRGSSAHRGMGESVIAALGKRDETTGRCKDRHLVHSKSRIGPEGPIAGFEVRHADLGTDDAGKPWGAGYIEVGEHLDANDLAKTKERPLSGAPAAYANALEEALIESGEMRRPYHDMPTVKTVDREQVRSIFYRKWPADGDEKQKASARRKAFSRGESELLKFKRMSTLEVDGVQLVWQTK